MKLGCNEIMITSIYFDSINDFINLEMGVKRYRGNMERFHFNPIPLNEYSRRFFPNIETFHSYNKKDKTFNDGRIFKYIIWYLIDYSTYLKEKEQGNICKNIEYTQYDRIKYGNKIPQEVKSIGNNCFEGYKSLKSIKIPTTIKEIGHWCFENCSSLKTINIPTTITKIGFDCFKGCKSLKSITIDKLQFVCEERIFMNEPVLVSIKIPENLQLINKTRVEKKDINEFIIPTTINELDEFCFDTCSLLKSILLPSTISELHVRCFENCQSLKAINIPTTITKIGFDCFRDNTSLTSINIDNLQFISEERIFMNEPVLVSIKIPENLQIINGKRVEKKDVNEFTIPTTINELDEFCFDTCSSLKSIIIPSSVSKLGLCCFRQCSSLTSIIIPSSVTSFGMWCFSKCGCAKELKKNKQIPRNCF
ncbi:hypothetical protein EDI_272700 [Entamoeba dispar SAW760]|uniref:Leucine rich repeat containing protein BspA family protein n=1 Tax=Entamoeba dispar (strain ATCC PRA-260 / SAW760) TaxID=370354 RepID=B0EU28_ENTDS|nr:uncharacterized protein EDI_272700 [Entamoeba dispar SAW760]EDR21945.1 hypothetical protein EDI_272700 [Entamoeba dispar SAW760]|eukprot:EDR21945.1 hypothetical protein EDI_272700 [Entamoeba dispar SAW760]